MPTTDRIETGVVYLRRQLDEARTSAARPPCGPAPTRSGSRPRRRRRRQGRRQHRLRKLRTTVLADPGDEVTGQCEQV